MCLYLFVYFSGGVPESHSSDEKCQHTDGATPAAVSLADAFQGLHLGTDEASSDDEYLDVSDRLPNVSFADDQEVSDGDDEQDFYDALAEPALDDAITVIQFFGRGLVTLWRECLNVKQRKDALVKGEGASPDEDVQGVLTSLVSLKNRYFAYLNKYGDEAAWLSEIKKTTKQASLSEKYYYNMHADIYNLTVLRFPVFIEEFKLNAAYKSLLCTQSLSEELNTHEHLCQVLSKEFEKYYIMLAMLPDLIDVEDNTINDVLHSLFLGSNIFAFQFYGLMCSGSCCEAHKAIGKEAEKKLIAALSFIDCLFIDFCNEGSNEMQLHFLLNRLYASAHFGMVHDCKRLMFFVNRTLGKLDVSDKFVGHLIFVIYTFIKSLFHDDVDVKCIGSLAKYVVEILEQEPIKSIIKTSHNNDFQKMVEKLAATYGGIKQVGASRCKTPKKTLLYTDFISRGSSSLVSERRVVERAKAEKKKVHKYDEVAGFWARMVNDHEILNVKDKQEILQYLNCIVDADADAIALSFQSKSLVGELNSSNKAADKVHNWLTGAADCARQW